MDFIILIWFCLGFCLKIGGTVATDELQKRMDILMVSTPFQGHIKPIINLGEELVNLGHRVTLITITWDDHERVVTEKGMNFISAGSFAGGKEQIDEMYKETTRWNMTAFEDMMFMQINPLVDYVNNLSLDMWDIIVTDDFSSNALACIAKKQGAPIMAILPRSNPIESWLNLPLWTIPQLTLFPGYPEQMSFIQRFIITILGKVNNIISSFHLQKLFYPPSIREECKSVLYTTLSEGHEYPLLVLSAIGYSYSRRITPLTYYIGPIYPKKQKGLSGDLEKWLSTKSSKQCILISMGSMASMTPVFASQIIQAVESSTYSVVWSMKKHESVLKDISYDPNRFFITSWIPQFAVMRHEAIAVAVLHGGSGGINDALYNAVPVVCMPFGGDQTQNCYRLQEIGVGIMLVDYQQTASNIKESIETICNDTTYQEKAQKFSKILLFGGGIDKAVALVELYGTVGYKHLIPSYVKNNWSLIQYYNIDVHLTIGFSALIMGVLVSHCVRSSKCCKRNKKV